MSEFLLTDPAVVEPPTVAATWQLEGERILSAMAGPGLARPEQLAGKTGLAIMTEMLNGTIPFPAMAKTLDFQLIEVSHGRAVFQGHPSLKHYNPLGSVHGGWFATLLDSALGCAVHTSLGAGQSYTTAELKLNITRPLTIGVPLVRAIGEVIHVGRKMATAQARLLGPDGRLYAHATTTCFIFET